MFLSTILSIVEKIRCKEERESCVSGGPFEGYMGIKPKEIGIWALSIND